MRNLSTAVRLSMLTIAAVVALGCEEPAGPSSAAKRRGGPPPPPPPVPSSVSARAAARPNVTPPPAAAPATGLPEQETTPAATAVNAGAIVGDASAPVDLPDMNPADAALTNAEGAEIARADNSPLAAIDRADEDDAGPLRDSDLMQALAAVQFDEPLLLDSVAGKSCVVLVYASWCPKCNVWSPTLFNQLRDAVKDQPVVVFAINADRTTRGTRYAAQHNFTAPNIIHGDDPTIVRRLGLPSELFYCARFDSEGKLLGKEQAGRYYDDGRGTHEYVIAKDISDGKLPGRYTVIDPSMPAALKAALWPLEMGRLVTAQSLLELRGDLPEASQKKFNAAVRTFLDKYLAYVQEHAVGNVPDQIRAFHTAEYLSESFGSTPQGRQAAAQLAEFNADEAFLREFEAARSIQRVVDAGTSPDVKRRALQRVAERFAGTYYGDHAAEFLAAEAKAGG